MEVITTAARDAAAAPHGAGGAIVQRAAALLNLSVQRTQALITKAQQQLGIKAPRKRRADAGQSAISAADLELIAGTILLDQRAGKWMIPLQETLDMLHAAGKIAAPLSASHTARLLRQRGLDGRSLAAPRAHVSMRTEHVNAVWQLDASVCVLYKTPKGELLLLEEDGVHYKNKPANLVRVMDQLLVRFVGVEHASGALALRYYSGGETTENALDFLMWMMTQRVDAQGTPMPLHGVPFMLYTDQGGCFKSAPFRNFCSAMDIRQGWHKPRNSRATGAVEVGQNITERGLEARLRFLDPATITIARLNAMAELWMHGRNGAKKHRRHGMTPYAAWATIGSEHLRTAPALEVMRELPMSLAQPRQVSGNMTVSYALKGQGSRDYDVRYVPGVSPRDKVLVCVNPLQAPAVRVGVTDKDTGEIAWHQVAPVQEGFMGYRADAPRLGKDEYQALPATPADARRARIAAQAFATAAGPATPTQAEAAAKAGTAPYLGQFDPFADIKARAAALPQFLQRPGTAHLAQPQAVQRQRVSVAAACQRLRAELKSDYDTGTYAWLQQQHGEAGVPEDVVDGLIAAHAQRQQRDAAPAAPALRAVGGA